MEQGLLKATHFVIFIQTSLVDEHFRFVKTASNVSFGAFAWNSLVKAMCTDLMNNNQLVTGRSELKLHKTLMKFY